MQGIFTRVFRKDSKSESAPAVEEGREEGMSSEVSHGYTTDEGSMEHREHKEERSRVSFDTNMDANLHWGDQLQMEGGIRMVPQPTGNIGEIEAEVSQVGNYSPSTPSEIRKSLIMPMVDSTQQNTWASHSSPVSSTPEGLGSSVISLEGRSPIEAEFKHLETVEETGVDQASVNVKIALPSGTAEVTSKDSQGTQSPLTKVTAGDTRQLQPSGELNYMITKPIISIRANLFCFLCSF